MPPAPPKASKKQIQAIVSVFETGKASGDPSAVALLQDGAGISYGSHQGTDKSGSLDAIVKAYITAKGVFAANLASYLDRLATNETAKVDPRDPPEWVEDLMAQLRLAGGDPIMRTVQEKVFDELYWEPAREQCEELQLRCPLSWAVVYDSAIHSGLGGIATIRKRFSALPPAKGGDEKAWTVAYVEARRAWLLMSKNPIVQKTVYRCDAFRNLIFDGNWDLITPFKVRGVTVG